MRKRKKAGLRSVPEMAREVLREKTAGEDSEIRGMYTGESI